jgi:hypothetical protein
VLKTNLSGRLDSEWVCGDLFRFFEFYRRNLLCSQASSDNPAFT